jgi:hypothetical protein
MFIENWASLSTGMLITIWNKHFENICTIFIIILGIQSNHVSKQ